jgi:enamine deaminase RidA (YjgF/YER057c/UK114 family)
MGNALSRRGHVAGDRATKLRRVPFAGIASIRNPQEESAVSETRFINPEALGKAPPGYTHVVEATAPARIVYIAGQLGTDREGKLSSDFRLQAVQAFENLKIALAAVGAQFRHVVKFNNYVLDMKHLPVFRQVRDSYLPDKNRPASTMLAISGLALEGALLEIEAVAVLPVAARVPAAGKSARGAAKVARKATKKKVKRRKGK